MIQFDGKKHSVFAIISPQKDWFKLIEMNLSLLIYMGPALALQFGSRMTLRTGLLLICYQPKEGKA